MDSNNQTAKNPEKNGRQTRRAALSLGAAGGIVAVASAVPSRWHKPVIDAVLLPAHASTSTGAPIDLAISFRWNTNQADWDLGVSFQGAQLTGKGGAIAGLTHGGDATGPLDTFAPVEDLRETITGPDVSPGSYRVFARLGAVDTEPTDSESGIRGSVTACGRSIPIAADLPDTSPGGEVNLISFTLQTDGTLVVST